MVALHQTTGAVHVAIGILLSICNSLLGPATPPTRGTHLTRSVGCSFACRSQAHTDHGHTHIDSLGRVARNQPHRWLVQAVEAPEQVLRYVGFMPGVSERLWDARQSCNTHSFFTVSLTKSEPMLASHYRPSVLNSRPLNPRPLNPRPPNPKR